MSAITIPNALPAVLVAVSMETIEARDGLLDRSVSARKTGITDEASHKAANAVFKELHTFARGVEAKRKELKAPLLDMGRQLDAAAEEAMSAIDIEKRELGAAIAAFEREENARREALRRQAEEEARRQEAEAMAAAEKRRAEEQAAADFDAPPGEPPAVVEDFGRDVVKPVAPAYTPPPLKGAVRTVTRKKVQITDLAKVPFMVNGIRLWKEVDQPAVKTLLEANIEVPGCAMVEEATVGAKGR